MSATGLPRSRGKLVAWLVFVLVLTALAYLARRPTWRRRTTSRTAARRPSRGRPVRADARHPPPHRARAPAAGGLRAPATGVVGARARPDLAGARRHLGGQCRLRSRSSTRTTSRASSRRVGLEPAGAFVAFFVVVAFLAPDRRGAHLPGSRARTARGLRHLGSHPRHRRALRHCPRPRRRPTRADGLRDRRRLAACEDRQRLPADAPPRVFSGTALLVAVFVGG